MSPPITEAELQAYVDDALDADARARVEDWLAEHPDDAQRVADYADQVQSLRQAYDPVLDEPIPSRMTANTGQRRTSRLLPSWRQLAAAVVLLAVGGAGGWVLRDVWTGFGKDGLNVAQIAISAHSIYVAEKRHAVEVEAKQEKHLVAWLSKRLGQPIKAPSLLTLGYRLVGGRLLPDDGKPAAHFMYEDEQGKRLTVYVRRNIQSRETAFQFVSDKGVSAFYWIDEDFAYALVGTLNRDGLHEAAKIIHRDLASKR
ncbi:MAG: anti-sigma factor [Alphaproteobacteria bacterium]|nr:anti-sigma factor [Alphaproteobacteria bacterium]